MPFKRKYCLPELIVVLFNLNNSLLIKHHKLIIACLRPNCNRIIIRKNSISFWGPVAEINLTTIC